MVKPVAFPPGRAKLCTKPLPTGSADVEKTTGIVRVSFSSAAASGVELQRMMSGLRATSSLAKADRNVGSALDKYLSY